jgi:hypothetical protein
MAAGHQGREQARRRFGDRARTVRPIPPLEGWLFDVEALFEPGGIGRARAAALRGNTSARQALRDFDSAVRDLEQRYGPDGGDAA